MKKQTFRYLFILFFCLINTNNLIAKEDENKYLLTEQNWKKLTAINQLIEDDQANKAIDQLHALIPETQDRTYDSAIIQQTLGYAYSRVEDYPKAIQAFRHALNSNALPDDVVHNLEFNLAQLLIVSQHFNKGLKLLERWIKEEPSPPVEAYILAGSGYYESEQFQRAIPYAKKIIKLKNSYDETWHLLLLNCYLNTHQYNLATNLLEKMLRFHPENKTYWQQLLATWQHANNDQKTLATMELMYTKGLFDNDDTKQLINMYLYLAMPDKAAHLLQTQLDNGQMLKNADNWELLGNCWLQAQEQESSANALIKAAQLSGDGNIYYRTGQIYFDLEDYPNSISHLRSAISAGELKHHSYAQLLLGIALFHQKNYSQSQHSLDLALNNRSTKNQAQWWIQRINDLEQEEDSTVD